MIILYSITLILSLTLGLFVFISNHRNNINRTFALLVVLISVWITTLVVADNTLSVDLAEIASKVALMSGFLIITCFWYFSVIFPVDKIKKETLRKIMIFLIVFIFISDFLVLASDLAVHRVEIESWGANVL
ncbi:hypothetical protein HGB13_03450, partial [bacterium]|nr:hypothetical protein [bacterium]